MSSTPEGGHPAIDVDGRSAAATRDLLERFAQIRGPLHTEVLETLLNRQATAAATLLNADAAGLSLLLEGLMRVPLAASSTDATTAEQLQFTLGEGPCLDSFTLGCPVIVPDVSDTTSSSVQRWPAYAEQLLSRTPFRAVFAVPLASEGLSLGTMSVYRREPGPISARELSNALDIANAIFFELIDTGTFGGSVQPAFLWLNLPLAKTRAGVWQAIGMASIELGLSTADALALLRAYCFGHDLLLDDVAADIVAHRLSLDGLNP